MQIACIGPTIKDNYLCLNYIIIDFLKSSDIGHGGFNLRQFIQELIILFINFLNSVLPENIVQTRWTTIWTVFSRGISVLHRIMNTY